MSLRIVERMLWALTACIAVLGVAAELARFQLGWSSILLDKLSLSYEQNVPTWCASMLLFSCALALVAIARQVAARDGDGARFNRHWTALAVVFLYLSLDETAGFHEQLNRFGPLPGIFHFAWVIPASLAVAVFASVYLPFVLHLTPGWRGRIVGAGALYVGGALGVELALAAWTSAHGTMNLGYRMIDALEESMELAGATLFLTTLLRIALAASQPISKS